MKQLHPRAVWLFFINLIIRFLFVSIFLAYFFVAFLFSSLRIALEEGFSLEFFVTTFSFSFLFIAVLFISLYIWARLSYRFYKYELTDNSFRKERGVIWKKYVSIPYDRIQNVDIFRGVWARILGLSDLHIQTAGISSVGRRGVVTEGRLPGLSKEDAEKLRDELIKRVSRSKNQGL